MHGVNYLLSFPYIDKTRVGICGWSYGGFLTYLALTKQPDFFKVGVPALGITSLPHLYETAKKIFPPFAKILKDTMGDPEDKEILKKWQERSALSYVRQLQAKIKLIHSENDQRCPMEQAELFREKLSESGKTEGKDFEYTILKDWGHWSEDRECIL
jgi:dipeptidyl aminopeptidase/acylaminoacyl peptidase